jgi:hypothetical protein
MGSSRDVMELFAERDIRQMFSAYDGWAVTPLNGSQSAGRVFQATRGTWGREETALIAVSFAPVANGETVNALDIYPDNPGKRTKKFLLTPQAANTSSIPPHVKILRMNAFAFAGGELVWLTKKKNAKTFISEPAVAS